LRTSRSPNRRRPSPRGTGLPGGSRTPQSWDEDCRRILDRRIPRDALLSRLYTKQGDPYNEEQLRRDMMLLWNTGYFDDVRVTSSQGPVGQVVQFRVVERRMIRTIKYEGNKSVTVSDILDRFKERKVGLSVESRYDPTKVAWAATVLGIARRARPPVRHRDARDPPDSAVLDRAGV
jgi:hypothetical protein